MEVGTNKLYKTINIFFGFLYALYFFTGFFMFVNDFNKSKMVIKGLIDIVAILFVIIYYVFFWLPVSIADLLSK